MSLSRVLRGTEAESMERWELPSVDGDGRSAAQEQARDTEEAPLRPPTAEELEDIRRRAREEGHAEGREAGYREGHDAGYKAGEEEIGKLQDEQKDKLRILENLVQAQAQPLEQLDDEVHEQLVRLVLTLARQVIRRELQTQPGEILAVIREAVGLLPMAARDVRVHVHPDDHRFLNELLGEDDSDRAWRLVDDPALSRGGCRVEAERSEVDATLERRLAQLASQLLGGREEDLRDELVRADGPGNDEAASGAGEPDPPAASGGRADAVDEGAGPADHEAPAAAEPAPESGAARNPAGSAGGDEDAGEGRGDADPDAPEAT
ncbi:flagellar assembly protein FliH [Aquisalimonas lutea]|uniref:flagellar assembly protein FliH n=1 Tax=Aquisalimonas lutea TaxID=1327750 RepID=UPI0025B34ADB|nr:flagellar assembly protein FliH [Aquisalimonas lutea]MDN3518282.1 flagellar assembly protein FliH [Aquisalimonas lutea]